MENQREIPGDNLDSDDNCYIDDLPGYVFVGTDGNVKDLHGNGTFIAGLLAGERSPP